MPVPSLLQFTVVLGGYASFGGIPVDGYVNFVPNLSAGDVVRVSDGSLTVGLLRDTIAARILPDGSLRLAKGGGPVQLYCDQDAFGLTNPLTYTVTFSGFTAGGKELAAPNKFTFAAPTIETQLDLLTVAPAPNVPAVGLPSVPVGGITGLSSLGELLLTASGDTVREAIGADGGVGRVDDAAGEWWCQPAATYQPVPYPRTIFGSIGEDGMILVCERNHVTGIVKRVELEISSVDDHNAPAVWAKAGHRPVTMWTLHGGVNEMRARVGDLSGRVESFAYATTQKFTGAGYSYTQIVHREAASTATDDAFWVFTRSSIGVWTVIPFTVSQATGLITWGTSVQTFRSFNPGNTVSHTLYIAVADENATSGNQKIRVACAHNPADTVGDGFEHALWYFEIDVVTGAVTSPDNPALPTTNILTNTNLPLQMTSLTPRITSTAGSSRRLFYVRPGPDLPAVALAEWTLADPDGATYRLHECVSRSTQTYNGMIPGVAGFASTPASTATNAATNGIVIEADVTLPGVATQVDVMRRYGTGNNVFFLRVLNTGALQVFAGTDVGNSTVTSGTALSELWGTRVKLRAAVNPTTGAFTFGSGVGSVAAKTVAIAYSTNGGTSWTSLTALTLTGTPTALLTSTAPVTVPAAVNTAMAAFHSAKLSARDGTVLAQADFETLWVPGSATYTDPQGNAWTLRAPAVVGRTTPAWLDRSYGPAGTRFGYEATANYLAGMGFDSPSYSRRVFVASSDGTTETLVRYDRDAAGADVPHVLLSRPTSEGRVVRPYPPVSKDGAAPYDTTFNRVHRYDHYTDYLMSSGAV